MSAETVYHEIEEFLQAYLPAEVHKPTRKRLTLLVVGMIRACHGAPSRIAQAIHQLGLTSAQAESLERRLRRTENDPQISAEVCLHPLARQRLLLGRPRELLLILDPTTQEDRVVMVSVAVWYRGRALPLAWTLWPANTPLAGEGFWVRIKALLRRVAGILPVHIPVTWLADRAFGTPAFTDLLALWGWHYVVRVQNQTAYRDRQGREGAVGRLVCLPKQRAKLRGQVFKKRGWREASVIVAWGRGHKHPLCLVSDLGTHWYLLRLYRRRSPIEATFRDYKSSGWQWEQGQVTNLEHLERLLVGMALATWIVLGIGTQVAAEWLARPATGQRRTVPWVGKRSLFQLGLSRLQRLLASSGLEKWSWLLTDWEAPNWQEQIHSHHLQAFIWAWHRTPRSRRIVNVLPKTVRP